MVMDRYKYSLLLFPLGKLSISSFQINYEEFVKMMMAK
jgi:hypothetical protein